MPHKESICNSNASTADMSLVGWVLVLNYCYGLSDGAVDITGEMETMEPLLNACMIMSVQQKVT